MVCLFVSSCLFYWRVTSKQDRHGLIFHHFPLLWYHFTFLSFGGCYDSGDISWGYHADISRNAGWCFVYKNHCGIKTETILIVPRGAKTQNTKSTRKNIFQGCCHVVFTCHAEGGLDEHPDRGSILSWYSDVDCRINLITIQLKFPAYLRIAPEGTV